MSPKNNVYNSYFFQFQPYCSWKGKSSTSIVAINSRPNTNQTSKSASGANPNLIYVEEANDYSSPFGKARPLKHYRKQLKPPRIDSAKSKPNNQNILDLPNSFVNMKTDVHDCNKCKENKDSVVASIQQNILRDNIDSDGKIKNIKSNPNDIFFDKCKNKVVRLCCKKQNNIIKSANTIIDKRYYTTHKAYLRSRVKTFDQNQSFTQNKKITYTNSNGEPYFPTNNFYSWQGLLNNTYGVNKPIAPQQFISTNFIQKSCDNSCMNTTKKTVLYKPSNPNFANEGAVSSGLRTINQQVNTITKNATSFYSVWGREGANAGRFRGVDSAPIFLKSRFQPCIPNLRRRVIWNSGTGRQPAGGFGNHTLCFKTPTGSIVTNTSGSILSQTIGTGTGLLIPEQKIFT